MLALDIATYLSGQGLGLTIASSGNLFACPFPATAPQASVSIVEGTSRPTIRAFGPDLGAPVAERPTFKVTVRDVLNNFGAALTLARAIHDKLDWLTASTGMAPSGARYMLVRAMTLPRYIGDDGNDRQLFVCDFDVTKARG